ncbi:unnamed protein product [Rangifer tarandus platyrhynchus]|uniref:Uncharacterized protein n=1 Tax=Rangifer tarandus platyrhynchus TaxID=3082113 RepID=A0ABN8XP76_RANTA|nr:unnamed protein product [Rangifer tarandus platyrhynchus]
MVCVVTYSEGPAHVMRYMSHIACAAVEDSQAFRPSILQQPAGFEECGEGLGGRRTRLVVQQLVYAHVTSLALTSASWVDAIVSPGQGSAISTTVADTFAPQG